MEKVNKVINMSLAGGLIGLMTTNPRRSLDNLIDKHNQDGWNLVQVIPSEDRNIIMFILKLIVLICTIGLYTFGSGYLLIMEKDKTR